MTNVMLQKNRINIKNIRLQKKCQLAQPSAALLAAFSGGLSWTFRKRAKRRRRPLRTLNVVQGHPIHEHWKMSAEPLNGPVSSSSTKTEADPAFDFVSRQDKSTELLHSNEVTCPLVQSTATPTRASVFVFLTETRYRLRRRRWPASSDKNGSGPGVRLRKSASDKKRARCLKRNPFFRICAQLPK